MVTLTNCMLTGNSATSASYAEGGAIYNSGGTVNLYNTTIAGNYAKNNGGGLDANGVETITNCIFYGNVSDTYPADGNIAGSANNVTFSDIGGGYSGTGNIDADPLFVNFQQASSSGGTTAGDFHLTISSTSVIDAGTTGANIPADDIDGDTRINPDMGAD